MTRYASTHRLYVVGVIYDILQTAFIIDY